MRSLRQILRRGRDAPMPEGGTRDAAGRGQMRTRARELGVWVVLCSVANFIDPGSIDLAAALPGSALSEPMARGRSSRRACSP